MYCNYCKKAKSEDEFGTRVNGKKLTTCLICSNVVRSRRVMHSEISRVRRIRAIRDKCALLFCEFDDEASLNELVCKMELEVKKMKEAQLVNNAEVESDPADIELASPVSEPKS